MISVLIPIYNYYVIDLVSEIHKQLIKCKYPFEIICLEDGSGEEFVHQNSPIKHFSNTNFIISKANNGRNKSRQILSEHAKYDWLLFLDSDVLPKNKDFISNYFKFIISNHEAIFGGFCYQRIKPNENSILRWKYGIHCEEVKAIKRNNYKYKIIIQANMFIKKNVFKSINSKIEFDGYGLDNYFSALMKDMKIIPYHIDNEVIHLGIEQSEVYLKKVENAVLNLIKLYRERKIVNHENDLYSFFVVLKRYRLHYLFSMGFNIFNSVMKRNLLGKHPSILLLQFYKISFMCNIYLNKKYLN